MEGDGAEEVPHGSPAGAGGEGSGSGSPAPAAAAENPSSSSSDSETDEEGAEQQQIETLEAALGENPLNYEAHVQYIQILRKLGHTEKLQQARESMNVYFLLSPKMWQEWAKDEASLSESSEAYAEIEKLYDRGVHEYLYVPLWCGYLNFIQEHDPLVCQCAPAGVSKMRNLFERALIASGLHIIEGNRIWEAYREFEQAILLTISDDNKEEKDRQVQRVRSIFHRQLSVPLVGLSSTLIAYKQWEVEQGNVNDINSELDGVPRNVVSAYQKAIDMYHARSQYEDQLSSCAASDGEILEKFMNYIKYEESTGDPAHVQILYERAVTEVPVSSDLWLAYTSYLDRTLKVPSVLKGVYSRATRNCTWVGDLWVRYMLSLERLHSSDKELSDVFEKSLQCSFPSFREYLDLFLTRIDSLRRRISHVDGEENGLSYSLIRETFQRAVDYLSPQVLTIDESLHLHAYWSRLEVKLGKDLVASRGVWESLIKKSGSVMEVWQSYIAMEIGMGHINEARSIYKRCYNRRFLGTGSEDICHSWLRFEREYGTLDDLDLAVKKVTPRLKELMAFKTQQESKTAVPITSKKEHSVAENAPRKRKPASIPNEKQLTAKRQKGSLHTDAGVLDKVTVAPPSKTVETEAAKEQQIEDFKSNESKPNFYTDQCTAFILNLSLEANENHLREFFDDCGGVTAIRLLKDKYTGRSRGLAYVDFSDDKHLEAAVAKNKQKLLGNKLNIARSDPKQSQKKAPANSSSSRGRGRGTHFRSVNSGKGAFSRSPSRKVNIVGKNTFAVPRSVVGSFGSRSKDTETDKNMEKPKSNDEFREILMKK